MIMIMRHWSAVWWRSTER